MLRQYRGQSASIFEDRFSSPFASGVLNQGGLEHNEGIVLTGEYDRLGRAIARVVSFDPDCEQNTVEDCSADEHWTRTIPRPGQTLSTVGVAKRGGVKKPMRRRANQPIVGFSPHHGGGGGHPHGHPHGHFGWGNWLDAGYDTFEIPVCPDGWAMLPDGTCVRIQSLSTAGATVGACCNSCPPAHVANLPRTRLHSVGAVIGPGGSGYPLGGGSTATGQPSSGNPTADALNLQWLALAQVVPTCLGANASLPSGYSPGLTGTTWSEDYQEWQAYYADIGSFSLLDITQDLTGWQAYANGWGSYIKAQCPTAVLPANFPTGSAGLNSLLPGGLTIGWVVVAVALAAGVWLLWPLLHAAV